MENHVHFSHGSRHFYWHPRPGHYFGKRGYLLWAVDRDLWARKSGKTTLCLSMIEEVQRSGGVAGYIDIDQTLDPSRAACLGVAVDRLIYARPENAIQAIEMMRTLTRSGALALVVLDSVTGLLTLGAGSSIYGHGDSTHQIFSQAVRELEVLAKKTDTAVLFTNDLRERAGYKYGVPSTTPGGISLKLHTSARIEITAVKAIRSGMEIIGEQVRLRVVKPKQTFPFHTTFINFMYNGTISRLEHRFDLAVEQNFITKRGSLFSYGDRDLGRGREGALSTLRTDPELAEEIEFALRKEFLPSAATKLVEGETEQEP